MKLALQPFSVNKAWRGGRRYKTSEYIKWQSDGMWLLKAHSRVAGEVTVRIVGHTTNYKRVDADNWIKPTLDLLVKADLIDDDRFIVEVSCKKIKDTENYLEIYIEPYELEEIKG